MTTPRARSAILFAACLLLGCTGKPAPPQGAPDSEAAAPGVVRVVFDLPGDDIGSPEAQALLEDVKAALVEKQAGEILSAGHRMGETEIVVRHQGGDALGKIRQALEAARPGAKYRIVSQTRNGAPK